MQQDKTTTPVLATHDLGKRFGALWAVRGIQLALQPGSITGLLGPNGAGKTTLIRMCAGLLRPDTGHVSVAGEQQTPANLHTRARLGVVSADAPLIGELTVVHMLRLQGVLYGLHGARLRAACAHAVDEFCLGEFQRRRIGVLYLSNQTTGFPPTEPTFHDMDLVCLQICAGQSMSPPN